MEDRTWFKSFSTDDMLSSLVYTRRLVNRDSNNVLVTAARGQTELLSHGNELNGFEWPFQSMEYSTVSKSILSIKYYNLFCLAISFKWSGQLCVISSLQWMSLEASVLKSPIWTPCWRVESLHCALFSPLQCRAVEGKIGVGDKRSQMLIYS